MTKEKMNADVDRALKAVEEIVCPANGYDSFAAENFYTKLIERLEACRDGAACAHEYD